VRLAATVKCGYYPASPIAVEAILKHLRLSDNPKGHFILDPCAGEGRAIRQIAEGLGVPSEHVYAVELDRGRTEQIKANIPGANVLGPATFMGVQITGHSFSLAYVNPPFDFELGGNRREEQAFVQKASHMLAHRGVLVLVMPVDKLIGNRQFVTYLDSHFEDVEVFRFPDGENPDGSKVRPYGEVVLFGRKRKVDIPADAIEKHGVLHQRQWQWRSYIQIASIPPLGSVQPRCWTNGLPSRECEEDIRTWEIPHGWKPATFKKTQFTDEELVEVVADSPLKVHFRDVPPLKPARPPLPLDRGHLGLILASGMLDGLVPGDPPHVVRGSSTKVEYHNKEQSRSEENPDTGAVSTTDVYSQRMVTIIRCVTPDGNIYSFSNEPKDDQDGDGVIDDD
jgi:predicted RNA methylase